MPDLGDSIGEIGGAIRAMLGLSRHSRVREQIRDTAELYNLTSTHEGLAAASENLAAVLTIQTKRLLDIASDTGRQLNWASAIVAWAIALGLGYAAYVLWPHWGTWWATPIFVLDVAAGGLMVIAGFGVLVQKKSADA